MPAPITERLKGDRTKSDEIRYNFTFICIRGLHYGCIIKSLCMYGIDSTPAENSGVHVCICFLFDTTSCIV